MQWQELHNKARTGKTRVWRIKVEGDQVYTEYGELGGAMQKVVDTAQAKNVGRSNEVSPEESALQMMDRAVLLKTRQGYTPAGEETRQEVIHWDKLLTTNLCFYKPSNTLSKGLEKKLEAGDATLTRKRDGEMMIFCRHANGEWEVYSRRLHVMHDKELGTGWRWKHRFDHIIEELEELDIPERTILLGEVVSQGSDCRWHVASVMKSLTPRAVELQENNELRFYCWDIAFSNSQDVLTTTTPRLRWAMIKAWFQDCEYILPIDVYDVYDIEHEVLKLWEDLEGTSAEEEWEKEYEGIETHKDRAMFLAKAYGWEGFVVVDPEGDYGDKAYNFRGKPDRPGKFCGKLKPEYEDDFVAFFDPDSKCGKWGRGKYQGQVGSVELHQYNSDGELIYICDCGGGIDDAFRSEYSDPEHYPLVLQVKYNGRTYKSQGDKTNALQFPRVEMVRTDKSMEECINERL